MPSPNPTVRRQHSGNAVPTTLSAPIVNGSDTSFTIASSTGWPDGSVGNFEVTINAGQADVEKILCSTRVGTTVNVATRGHDSTTAAGHATGATVTHTISALEIDEMNQHTNATSGVHGAAGTVVGTSDSQTLTNKTIDAASNTLTGIVLKSLVTTKGDVIAATAASTPARVAVGTDGQYLMADSASAPGVKWAQGATKKTQTFTSGAGNWTVPTGVTVAQVTVIGGGGGGLGGTSTTSGSGGGGGQVIAQTVTGLTPGGTVAYTVGGGGAAGSAGSASSFGSLSAVGGGAGISTATPGNYAADGTAGSWPGCGGAGNNSSTGTRGRVGVLGYSGGGGGGGGSATGTDFAGGAASDGGGAGGTGAHVGAGGNGTAGTANTGGGGGGGGICAVGNTSTGGAGGSGVVIIEWVA